MEETSGKGCEFRRVLFRFFFQAEDGIRDDLVTGVQTCALPIFLGHIMISYSWSIQPQAKELKQVLQDNGYRVWMDIDNMG